MSLDGIFSPNQWFKNDKYWNSSSTIPSLPTCTTQPNCEFACINFNNRNPLSPDPCVGYNFSRLGYSFNNLNCSPTTGQCYLLAKVDVNQAPLTQDQLKTWTTYIIKPQSTAVSPTVVPLAGDVKNLRNFKKSTLILAIILGFLVIVLYIIGLIKNKKK
jgi:hypothetical protein